MAQKVGKIPEFTDETSVNQEETEVKETEAQAPAPDEKDTQPPPVEKPATEESGEDTQEPSKEELLTAVEKLKGEKTQLLKDIKELRGSKREIKQEQLRQVEQHIDDLKDLHPDDVAIIDRVLRSKGYMTKDEAGKMFYEAVKQEELDKFLAKYPEYRPENDPDNIRWGAFERQIEKEKDLGYSLPKNPHLIGAFLERVHSAIAPKGTADRASVQRRIQVAGVGAGGSQQSVTPAQLDPERRAILVRGGWTEEDIKRIESRLTE